MKLIGLLGGTSWPSTMLYYERLNQLINQKLASFNSSRILLYSINYNEIKKSYATNWENVERLLKIELEFFLTNKPDCLIICNNTLHKAFDNINLDIEIPVFHAGILSAKFAKMHGYKSVLLLGTRFTMEDGFFAKYFENLGINAIIPNENDRIQIQNLQMQISSGVKNNDFYDDFAKIISQYTNFNINAICLACTELPLYINPQNCALPIINPIELQCNEAVNFAIQ